MRVLCLQHAGRFGISGGCDRVGTSVGRTEPEGDQRGRQFGPDVRRIGCYAGSRRNRNRCDPSFYGGTGLVSQGLTDLVEVDSMHERKQRMADLSDAVIALPGGCGTLEELLEVITWKQLGLYLNPIVILNINGYFDPLLEMFRRAVDEHFMRPQHAALWAVASTPAEAVELIYAEPVWDASLRKQALV